MHRQAPLIFFQYKKSTIKVHRFYFVIISSLSPSSKHQGAYAWSPGDRCYPEIRSIHSARTLHRYDTSQKCLRTDAWRSRTSVLLPHGIMRNEAGTCDDVGGTAGGSRCCDWVPPTCCAFSIRAIGPITPAIEKNTVSVKFCFLLVCCCRPFSAHLCKWTWSASIFISFSLLRLKEAPCTMFWLKYMAHVVLMLYLSDADVGGKLDNEDLFSYSISLLMGINLYYGRI